MRGSILPIVFLFSLAFGFGPRDSMAAPMAATAVKVSGAPSYVMASDGKTYPISSGTKFAEGDTVKTGAGEMVTIEFENGNRIILSERTELTIKASRLEPDGGFTSIFGLALGRARSLVSKFTPGASKFEYQTKTAVAGVAGTDFITEVPDPDVTMVAVLPPGLEDGEIPDSPEPGAMICSRPELQGKSRVYVQGTDSAKTTVNLTSCFMTTVSANRAPAQPTIIPDDMLFNMRKLGPMAGLAPENLMIENLGHKVSTPLTSQNMNSLLNNLNTTLVHGGPANMVNNVPVSGQVPGSAVVNIK
ncbi:MAG: FecR family protein [Nitrospinota bacterium]|nr:FecR family protein [Nitrospinota bacterium]